jgi:hypothetical protein
MRIVAAATNARAWGIRSAWRHDNMPAAGLLDDK